MRIISQNKSLNVNFDLVHIWVKYTHRGYEIVATESLSRLEEWTILGTYSTKEKAEKIFSELVRAYGEGVKNAILPLDEEMDT